MLLLATFQKWVTTPLLPSNNSLEPIMKTTLGKMQQVVLEQFDFTHIRFSLLPLVGRAIAYDECTSPSVLRTAPPTSWGSVNSKANVTAFTLPQLCWGRWPKAGWGHFRAICGCPPHKREEKSKEIYSNLTAP
jgi:hypothetical protein